MLLYAIWQGNYKNDKKIVGTLIQLIIVVRAHIDLEVK